MEASERGRRDERHHKRYRSRSYSEESDNERDHRRRDRQHRDKTDSRNERLEDDRSDKRHRDDDRHRRHRRSRSPRNDVRRYKSDRDSQHKSRRSLTTGAQDSNDRESSQALKRSGPLPSQEVSFQKDTGAVPQDETPLPEKEQPNYKPTGLLAAASNSVAQADGTSIVLKYHEPPEARKPSPKDQWKLFVFKGGDIVDTIDLSLRSCWLIGREVAVVDLPAEHPSISKQHAVIQFRYIEKRNEFGDKSGRVRPYLIDLDSANGTALNKEPIPASRYLELRDKDMIQFGDSTREYVLMLAPKS